MNHASGQQIAQLLASEPVTEPRIETFREQIIEFVSQSSNALPEQDGYLASSDIIESIIGKQKYLSGRSPLTEVGKTILLLPLTLVEITPTLVRNAMESVQNSDFMKWVDETLGPSSLSRRKAAFQGDKYDTVLEGSNRA